MNNELPSGFLEVDSVDFNVSKLLDTERRMHDMVGMEKDNLKLQNGYNL